MNLKRLIIIFAINTFAYTTALAAPDDGFTFPVRDGHCVAWKARKRMFLVQNVEPVGTNCQITSRVVTVADGEYAELRIPVMGFDSGNSMRDKDVAMMLGAAGKSDIVVRTLTVPKGGLQEMWDTGGGILKSEIEIAGRKVPVEVSFKVFKEGDVSVARGTLTTTFGYHGLTAPSVAGGLVTKVDEQIQLHYQLRRDRFLQ
jgi:hypothetical protein